MGGGLYDPDLKKELWRLENDINSKNQDVRLGAMDKSKGTNSSHIWLEGQEDSEIKDIAIQHQENAMKKVEIVTFQNMMLRSYHSLWIVKRMKY